MLTLTRELAQSYLDQAVEAAALHVATNPSIMRAAEAAAALDPIGGLLQYGVLGLVVVGFMTGWIVPGPQFKAMAAENARLQTLIDGKLFPMVELHATTMERSATALEHAAEAMNEISRGRATGGTG